MTSSEALLDGGGTFLVVRRGRQGSTSPLSGRFVTLWPFMSVIHSVHGGICLSACWDTTPQEQTPPRSRRPPGADTPLEQTPPRAETPPGTDTPPEQTPPGKQTPAYGQRPAGTHPTRMHSCLIFMQFSAKTMSNNKVGAPPRLGNPRSATGWWWALSRERKRPVADLRGA